VHNNEDVSFRSLLAVLTLVVLAGCSGKTATQAGKPAEAAGTSSLGTGGHAGETAEGGVGAEGTMYGAGTGTAGGRAGTSGSETTAGAAGLMARGGSGGEDSLRGGAAGLGTGGSAGFENRAGAAGSGAPSGTVPAAWTCQKSLYGDGKSCDCGCGAVDPDCKDAEVGSCDKCLVLGGCAHANCPSNLVPGDNAHCSTPPDWLCDPASYGNGVCDCGCGVIDIDCPNARADACGSCPITGCARYLDCSTIDPNDNTICTSPPTSWTCGAATYRDGSCDCGCGFWDPDCSTKEASSCQACATAGSCSHQVCPGTIDPGNNARCVQPAPPAGWTCSAESYADSHTCDCGCGIQDPDCPRNTPDVCIHCGCGIRCPDSVDAADPTHCAPPPPTWTCPTAAYGDSQCDCGCGALDVDCETNATNQCELCDGCARGHCQLIDPSDNTQCLFPSEWTCGSATFGDGTCDCGCGLVDLDCESSLKSNCQRCDAPGSCSNVACADPQSKIKPADAAFCSN
jgi:hypothetical protein